MILSTILYFLFPLAVSAMLIPIIKVVANSKKLYDMPSDRKLHVQPIPALGGVAIFISFCLTIGILLNAEKNAPDISFVLLAALLLFVVGIWDDLKGLSAKKRLVVQFITATICFVGGYVFTSDYGIVGWGTLPVSLRFLSTTVFIVLLINAFNLIDGINGLAGGLGLILSLGFSCLFAASGHYMWAAIALVMSGSILGFLKYNYDRASIFMGDNGSTFLGLMAALFFIQYLNMPTEKMAESHQSFILGWSLLAVPVLDLLRVSIERILKGQSPFHADQIHIHHLLLNCVKSHKTTTLIIIAFQLFLVLLTQLLMAQYGPVSIFMAIVLAYGLFVKVIEISDALTSIKMMEADRRQLGMLY